MAIGSVKPEKDRAIFNTISNYYEHLEKKLADEGLLCNTKNNDIITKDGRKMTPKQEKLIARFRAINELFEFTKAKDMIDAETELRMQQAVVVCLKNQPEWTERKFLQKLADIVSFGLFPLVRTYFSKEREYTKQLDQEEPNTPRRR